MFSTIYRNRRVLITGHTGFKGSWLGFWLHQLGAELLGYALAPPTHPCHYGLLDLGIDSVEADILDPGRLVQVFAEFAPEIVFHLAAQPLVRESYRIPMETFATNVMGTIHVLEATRSCKSVRAVVNVTSDKCYENREWIWGYRECEPMGGHDPYSASKGCAELVAGAYRRSFFHPGSGVLLASCRAGNVIGGGDWAADRLVPDLMRGAAAGKVATLRNPGAMRPWQHVLEPLAGYLLTGQKLLQGEAAVADGWNFGPGDGSTLTVGEVAARLSAGWDAVKFEIAPEVNAPHEAGLLNLDCSKARHHLGWHPVWDAPEALARTSAWYKAYYEQGQVNTADDLEAYCEAARRQGIAWAMA